MATDTTLEKRPPTTVQAERMREGRTYVPQVDILEQPDKLLLYADMPGVRREDLDITYERGLLTVHGKVAPRDEPPRAARLLREYGVGDWFRSFEIGEGIDAAKIEAELTDGVLTLHLPKAQRLMPRKIAVKTA